jgi:DNA-binding NtrC family response regulator
VPGNVRELENAVQRAAALFGSAIQVDDLLLELGTCYGPSGNIELDFPAVTMREWSANLSALEETGTKSNPGRQESEDQPAHSEE